MRSTPSKKAACEVKTWALLKPRLVCESENFPLKRLSFSVISRGMTTEFVTMRRPSRLSLGSGMLPL